MPNLVGIGLSQVPTNSMLGGLAYQSPDHAIIKRLHIDEISQINAELIHNDTVQDIYIYDTSKDSDGGAWRKKTQHLSWYNEELGTTVRGTRREFPAVAVLALEAEKLTIYDGDDPNLPMWMVFNSTTTKADGVCTMLGSNNDNAMHVRALNGIIAVGEYESYGGLVEIMFPADNARRRRGGVGNNGTQGYWDSKYISTRNTGNIGNGRGYNDDLQDANNRLYTDNVLSLSMAVLPDAPISQYTGLPEPTYLIGHVAALTVLKHDGTRITRTTNWSSGGGVFEIEFDKKHGGYWFSTAYYSESHGSYPNHGLVAGYSSIDDTSALQAGNGNFSTNLNLYQGTSNNNLPGGYWTSSVRPDFWFVESNGNSNGGQIHFSSQGEHFGTQYGLTFFDGDFSSIGNSAASSLGCYITKDYNTGWMPSGIRGCYLASTDATNVTGTELIPNPGNGNFTSTTNWQAKDAGGTVSVSSGNLVVSTSGNYQGCEVTPANLPTLVSGKRYVMTVDVASVSAGSFRFGVVSGATYNGITGAGVYSLDFTSNGNVEEIFFDSGTYGSAMTFQLNSVNLRLAERDRSVYDYALGVYGTINKSAVATGAELVMYHGFNSTNYLRHVVPVNYGNGATITMGGWSKISASSVDGDYRYLCSVRSGTIPAGIAIHRDDGGSNSGRPYFYDSVNISLQESTIRVDDNEWHHILGVLDGTSKKLYIDGELVASATVSNVNLSNVTWTNVGHYIPGNSETPQYNHAGYLALIKFSASAPSDEQVRKMYNDEKHLFHENAKCTLYGTSDTIKDIEYDEVTGLVHVGTSSGRSDFQGLRRINNTTTAVTAAISAYDEFIVEQ
jgi:hypothetical protein